MGRQRRSRWHQRFGQCGRRKHQQPTVRGTGWRKRVFAYGWRKSIKLVAERKRLNAVVVEQRHVNVLLVDQHLNVGFVDQHVFQRWLYGHKHRSAQLRPMRS